MPGKSEIDVPLSYADYYFLEALLRATKQWAAQINILMRIFNIPDLTFVDKECGHHTAFLVLY